MAVVVVAAAAHMGTGKCIECHPRRASFTLLDSGFTDPVQQQCTMSISTSVRRSRCLVLSYLVGHQRHMISLVTILSSALLGLGWEQSKAISQREELARSGMRIYGKISGWNKIFIKRCDCIFIINCIIAHFEYLHSEARHFFLLFGVLLLFAELFITARNLSMSVV